MKVPVRPHAKLPHFCLPWLLAASLVAGLSSPLHGQGFLPPLEHNGIGGSLEPMVNVDAQYEYVADDPLSLQIEKKFQSGAAAATHVTEIVGPPEQMRFDEFVTNNTGRIWTDYHIEVDVPGSASSPFGFNGYSLHEAVPGTVTLSSVMEELDEANGNHAIWFFFDDPVDPGESFEFKSLVNFNPSTNGARFLQSPSTVPEASSLALALVGLVAAGLRLRARC